MLPYGTIVTSSPINLLQAISVPRACVLCIGSIMQHRDRQTSPGSGNVPRVGISNARCNRGYGHRRRLTFTSASLGVAQGFQTMGMDGVKWYLDVWYLQQLSGKYRMEGPLTHN
ncbi:hypothetical protein FOIG_04506 [Fusarium odoratissimum NRRL 54006]|uniref:Uncharacterized protein n=2 Tax=Fusarium oxysporum species complex TaxID=171631 RepID=X0LB92_FUSO5|nr:uncharacterized protein FOIG_04506 [Fusarium odoratissimum NRRL 54006]EXM06120.1 hypothetical protein FOIG_04506 [Fusarium odoratissimum NRRL 54006]TXC00356.1 hypothetical protein FocTR4_00013934 [Fusarium oxysporum f. sp. cubense]